MSSTLIEFFSAGWCDAGWPQCVYQLVSLSSSISLCSQCANLSAETSRLKFIHSPTPREVARGVPNRDQSFDRIHKEQRCNFQRQIRRLVTDVDGLYIN